MYLTVKLIHIISATLLFGTGLGSAFYMFMAYRSGSMKAMAVTNRIVVIADYSIGHRIISPQSIRPSMDVNLEPVGIGPVCVCRCMLATRRMVANMVAQQGRRAG